MCGDWARVACLFDLEASEDLGVHISDIAGARNLVTSWKALTENDIFLQNCF